MLNEFIRNAKSLYLSRVIIINHKFENSTTHSSLQAAIFNGDHLTELGEYPMKQLFINRFHETHIIMSCTNTLLLQLSAGCNCIVTNVTDGKNCNVLAIFYLSSFTYFYF